MTRLFIGVAVVTMFYVGMKNLAAGMETIENRNAKIENAHYAMKK